MIPGKGSPNALLEPAEGEPPKPLEPRLCVSRYAVEVKDVAADP